MDEETIDKFMKAAIQSTKNNNNNKNFNNRSTDPQIKIKLKAILEEFEKMQTFKSGDVICYKKGFQHKRSVGPFIVTEILDEPIINNNDDDAGSIYFREPLDIIAGFLDDDGDFIIFHFDSRRMQLFENE